MRALAVLAVAASLAIPACATTSGSGPGGGSADTITAEELREADVSDSSLHEVVRRLRSSWLRARGGGFSGRNYAKVFVDGTEYGDLDVLRSLQPSDVEEVVYLDSRDATTRFGTGYPGGIIAVSTRR